MTERTSPIPYTAAEIASLKALWPLGTREAIEAALPGRTWKALQRRAYLLGLVREREALYPCNDNAHPIFLELRRIRLRRRITRAQLAQRLGYHTVMISKWENNATVPSFFAIDAWCQALGVSLKIDNQAAYVTPASKGKAPEFHRKPDMARMMAGR